MSHSTPFFQGFSSLLFGRPALSDLEKLLRKVASLRSLSDFFQTFGFLVPEVLLERRPKGESSRQRRFSLHVTFCSFLAFWQLSRSGVDALMRLHHARKPDFRKGIRLGPGERLITWAKPAKCPKGVSEDGMEALHGRPSKQKALLSAMLEIIAKDLVPLRPGREEPRARKRRPKSRLS